MCRYFFLLWTAFAGLLFSACADGDFSLQAGDLVFRIAGEEGMSSAVAASTAWNDSLKFDHVAIVAVGDGKPYIIEAAPDGGVRRTSWEEFIESGGAVVMRVNVDFPVDMAIERASGFIGQDYDWHFLPDNGKLYCSELVWESYLYADGSRLFEALPMNFRDSDGNMPVFWEELFRRFGEPVPEGVPGTNPNDMAKSPCLTFVRRF